MAITNNLDWKRKAVKIFCSPCPVGSRAEKNLPWYLSLSSVFKDPPLSSGFENRLQVFETQHTEKDIDAELSKPGGLYASV